MLRIAEGKYLKLLHDMFDRAGLLELDEGEIRVRFCPDCDLKGTCIHEGSEGKLSPLCLDEIAFVISGANANSEDRGVTGSSGISRIWGCQHR